VPSGTVKSFAFSMTSSSFPKYFGYDVAINKKGIVGAYALQKGFNFSVFNNEGNKLNDAAYLI
jgi:hypothetical protein